MVSYVNDLRLSELATGEGSGTWGTTTNTNLELIGEALGYATEQSFGSDADATTTVGDGVSDPARAMYFKVTSAVSLTATRTLTIAPNTVSRVMFIENATSGSQSIAISQGSGANVTIATGKTAIVYLDGAGSGAAVVDAMAGVDPGVTDTLAEVLTAGNATGGTDIAVGTGDDITFADSSKAIFGAGSDLQIYHDGSNSFISDVGTGNLGIRAENLFLQNADGSENYATATLNGAFTLSYDNSQKLATTATGIDVTGAVTADGLTVDSGTVDTVATFQSSGDANAYVVVKDSGSSGGAFIGAVGTHTILGTGGSTERMRIDSSGNVGIGRTPRVMLDVAGEVAIAYDATYGLRFYNQDQNNWSSIGNNIATGSSAANLVFKDSTGEVMRLSSGNVGIGTSSPSEKLTIAGDVQIGESSGGEKLKFVGASSKYNFLVGKQVNVDNALEITPSTAAGGNTFSTPAVVVNSSGNVGIGTSSPYGALTVDTANGILNIANGNTSGGTKIQAWGATPSNGYLAIEGYDKEYARFDASGNVGIGTSSPQAAKFSGSAVGILELANTKPVINIHETDVTDAEFFMGMSGGSAVIGTSGNGLMIFQTGTSSTSERMRIDSSGNVLVGTTSDNVANQSGTTQGVRIAGAQNIQVASTGIAAYFNRLSTDGDIVEFRRAGTAVGSIGTVDADLTVFSKASGHKGLRFGSGYLAPTNNAGTIEDAAVDLGISSHRFKDLHLSGVMYSGTARIGTTTTNSGATVNIKAASNGIQVVFQNSSGTTIGYIGNVSDSSTIYATSSDYRLKENVVAMTGATDRLKQLNPTRFNFIADADVTVDGFLAHEVQDVVPEAITGTKDAVDDDGNAVYQGIDQSKLVPLLVATIQELEARITQLENN